MAMVSMDQWRKCPLEDCEETKLMVYLDFAKESPKFSYIFVQHLCDALDLVI